jgi:hypothetical protein
MVFPFGLGMGPLAAVNFVSVDDGLQMLRQKAHCQSPSPYLVRFDAVWLFASEQSRLRGAAEEADEARQTVFPLLSPAPTQLPGIDKNKA